MGCFFESNQGVRTVEIPYSPYSRNCFDIDILDVDQENLNDLDENEKAKQLRLFLKKNTLIFNSHGHGYATMYLYDDSDESDNQGAINPGPFTINHLWDFITTKASTSNDNQKRKWEIEQANKQQSSSLRRGLFSVALGTGAVVGCACHVAILASPIGLTVIIIALLFICIDSLYIYAVASDHKKEVSQSNFFKKNSLGNVPKSQSSFHRPSAASL